MKTAVEWLVCQIESGKIEIAYSDKLIYVKMIPEILKEAKEMEKEQMLNFAEYVARYPDKNKNYLGQMLHAKSKYDDSERTVDLLEEFYKETYGK